MSGGVGRWAAAGSSLKLCLVYIKHRHLVKMNGNNPQYAPPHPIHACAHEEGMFCSLWGGILFNSDEFRSHEAFSGNVLFLAHRNVTEQERNKTRCWVFYDHHRLPQRLEISCSMYFHLVFTS